VGVACSHRKPGVTDRHVFPVKRQSGFFVCFPRPAKAAGSPPRENDGERRGPERSKARFPRERRWSLSLGLELLIAFLMVPVLALTHGLGLLGMSRFFNLTDDALLRKRLSARSMLLVAFVAVLLFALHAFEIGLLGLLYLASGAVAQVEQALVVSASYYTTTGAGSDTLPDGWRLIGHGESLMGLLMVGWSTAYLVRKIDRLQQRGDSGLDEERHRRLRMGTGFGGHEEEAES